MSGKEEFYENIDFINKAMDEKDAEIRRLMAENLELKLKIQNLQYFISTITRRNAG